MLEISLPVIPWTHSSSDLGSFWVWETEHFKVVVNGGDRSCYYAIENRNPSGALTPFADGRTATFEEAETQVREVIGKAYPPILGYRRFAGPLATTFSISDGTRLDFGPYAGRKVRVKVLNRDGASDLYTGALSVDHYNIMVANGNDGVRIPPSYIVSVEFADTVEPKPLPSKFERMVPGYPPPGCSGKPGSIPGTTEHLGAPCPVHEQGRQG